MTDGRFTGSALEPWYQVSPDARFTGTVLEVWISNSPAPIPLPPKAKLGPRAFLGIPPRRFRERSKPIFDFPVPEPLPPIILPGNHMGPNGLFGIASFRRFRERSNSPYWNSVPPDPGPRIPIVIPGNHMGPNGLLGIPIRRFRERAVPIEAAPTPPPPSGTVPAFFWVIT